MPAVNVQQLSVFIENKAGRITEMSEVLGAAGVNMRGFSITETPSFGIARLVVDDPQRGRDALSAAGFTVKTSSVLCVHVPDTPGGLAAILRRVSDAGVNVEYVYALLGSYIIINVADIDRAVALLEGQQVALTTQEEIARL